MARKKNDLNPEDGDLIAISRGIYRHWAVYVGDGFVVHLALASNDRNEKALVKKEKLKDVVGNAKWRINNSHEKDDTARPAEDIVRDACALIGKTLYYNVIGQNCEHFVKKLRYGKAKSWQVLAGGMVASFIGSQVMSVRMASGVLFPPLFLVGAAVSVCGLLVGYKNI